MELPSRDSVNFLKRPRTKGFTVFGWSFLADGFLAAHA